MFPFHRSLNQMLARFGRPAVAASAALLLALVSLGAWAGHKKSRARAAPKSHVHKGFADHRAGGKKADRFARIGQSVPGRSAGDELGGPVSLEEEKLADRALPGDSVPVELSHTAQQAAVDLQSFHDDDENMPSAWKSIGPNNAVYPAFLNRTGATYVTSGRVTALAIDPRCRASSGGDRDGRGDRDDREEVDEGRCRLFVGAAGGGIWRTTKPLSNTPKWSFISGSFATNAIGSIAIDPRDPDTIYVGTGEPNASGDSAAGRGLYRSRDGGDTWQMLAAVATVNGVTYQNFARDLSAGTIAIDPRNSLVLYVGVELGVRGVSASGGATIGIPGIAPIGLYKSTDGGATFTRLFDGGRNPYLGPSFWGVNSVKLDPVDPSIIYAASPDNGIWRSWSADEGGAFVQVFQNQSLYADPDRTELAIARLPNGKTRIYAGTGAIGPYPGYAAPLVSESQVWRIDDATRPAAALIAEQKAVVAGGPAVAGGWKKLTSRATGSPGYATYNFCTGQCWYDIGIYTPEGEPDTVFVLGSYQYGEAGRISNSRAVLRSTTAGEPDAAGVTFTDLSRDAATPQNGIHPDQHALVTLPGNSAVWFEGSDGGVMRSSGKYTSISSQCATRPLSPASMVTCKRLLSSVPTRLTSLNFGLNTLQFQSLSINPQRPTSELQGGTQDNGTFQYEGSSVTWMQTIFGDGGQSGFDAKNPTNRFHTYYAPQVDVNFRAGEPKYWVWISDPFFPGGRQVEKSAFYIPIIPDPVPSQGGTIFAGLQSVWRTQDNGGSQAFLEANCGEFLPSADPTAICGDWVRISPKLGLDGTVDWVVALGRSPGDTGTLWAGTRRGKIFVSKNADTTATNPDGSVAATWTRLDTLSPAAPDRFPSAIHVDSANPDRAYISYSGYSARTPARPGHVFQVDSAGGTATWTSLDDGAGPLGDMPVTALARDDATGDLYAGTDFGVMRRTSVGHWHLAATGLPAVEVPHLAVDSSARVLYAGTHGRGAWRLWLPGARDDD